MRCFEPEQIWSLSKFGAGRSKRVLKGWVDSGKLQKEPLVSTDTILPVPDERAERRPRGERDVPLPVPDEPAEQRPERPADRREVARAVERRRERAPRHLRAADGRRLERDSSRRAAPDLRMPPNSERRRRD